MSVTTFFNDTETFSEANLKKVGTYRYARDESTKLLMAAYSFGYARDAPVDQWVPAEGEKMPRDFRDALRDPEIRKSAWHAAFEKAIYRYVLGEEVYEEEWRCSMVHAMTLSLPGQLEKAGPILDLTADKLKDKRGKQLIGLFCGPHNPTKKNPFRLYNFITHPEEWEEFKGYNKQDVVAEKSIARVIKPWDLPRDEWEMYAFDQQINDDGVPINMAVVERAIEFVEYIREKRYRAIRRITGIENPRSNPQMLKWLRANGYRFDDLKKGHVERAAEDEDIDDEVRQVLRMRVEVAKTSTDKYYAMQRAQTDGIVQGAFQFAGAQRTWRWSGRIFQPQNLARPHPDFEKCQPDLVRDIERLDNYQLELLYDRPLLGPHSKGAGVMDMLSSAIKPTIQAPDGEMIFSADLNAIENRVLGYLSGCEAILRVFHDGLCPYLDFAVDLYDSDYETERLRYEDDGKKDHRTIAKPGVLGCGYMLSAGEERENKDTGEVEATGLLGYAWNMGVKTFTLDDSVRSVKVWRKKFEDAVKYWWEIEKAAKKAIRTKKPQWAGPVEFVYDAPFLKMWLPSGRALSYVRPRIEETEQYFCERQRKYLPWHLCKEPNRDDMKIKENITYEGENDNKSWVRIQTHPGKLTENADQAISRDILKEAMLRFRARVPRSEGRLRLHVHDEPVGIGPERFAERNLKILIECLTEEMPWASAHELPLGAAGSISKVWIKD